RLRQTAPMRRPVDGVSLLTMELDRLYDELVRTAERAGVRVRAEPFDPNLSDVKRPRGGLCILRGVRILLVDSNLPLPERIGIVAGALSTIDLEHLYVTPRVRQAIAEHASSPDGLPQSPSNDSE